ncbi:MAG: hypothetical protein AB1603_06995 [Chloroflexota bacterium]
MADDYLKKALRVSYGVSTGLALLMGLGFFLVTSFTGDHTALARYGGASWVFTLALIIALPTVTPFVKRRIRSQV